MRCEGDGMLLSQGEEAEGSDQQGCLYSCFLQLFGALK